ncbi:MAG: polysaccharide deacetylase family protein [Legionella sp.]|nr:polysaccharide deacetylase family protein [Legionella sp.]
MGALRWKRGLGQCYLVDKRRPRKIILLYHAVGSGADAMDTQLFSEQMAWLSEYCEVMSLSDLLRVNSNSNKIQVAISFDDGYACLYDVCAPILKRLNIPAIVYLNTAWVASDAVHRLKSNPDLGHYPDEHFLIWNEVKQFVSDGWEIGSHGVDHVDLTRMTRQMHDLNLQLSQSKQAIEDNLEQPCVHFAYTWGKHSSLVRERVKKTGYQYAVAAHHRVMSSKADAYALPRMNIEKAYSMDDFIGVVQGRWDYLGLIHAVKYHMSFLKRRRATPAG